MSETTIMIALNAAFVADRLEPERNRICGAAEIDTVSA